jgi:hypothetical protein
MLSSVNKRPSSLVRIEKVRGFDSLSSTELSRLMRHAFIRRTHAAATGLGGSDIHTATGVGVATMSQHLSKPASAAG